MVRNLFVLSFVLSFSVASWGSPAASVNRDGSCHEFELPVQIGQGSQKYPGQCLDTDRFRAAQVLLESGEFVQFGNYLHQDQYWTATVNKAAVIEQVYLQVVRFTVAGGVVAGHAQYRVKMAPGHEIQLQAGGKTSTTNDVIISFEAARPKDISYNFAHGMADNYILVGRVASGEQRAKEYGEDFTIEQYKMTLPAADQMTFLIQGLKASEKRGYATFYDTLKPNCTTEVFDIIDQLPSQRSKRNEAFLTVISNDPVVGPTIEGLVERDLFGGCAPNLRDELQGNNRTISPALCEQRIKKAPLTSPFFPEMKDLPYSLVFAANRKADSPIVQETQKSLYQSLPLFLQHLGASLMLQGDFSAQSLLAAFSKLSPLLKAELVKLEDQVGSQPVDVALYLIPWKKTAKSFNVLQELGVPARLGFNTYRSPFKLGQGTLHHRIIQPINQAGHIHRQNQAPFGLTGAVIQVHLEQGEKSSLGIQFLAYTGGMEKPMAVENDLVQIQQMIIPSHPSNYQQPMALISLQDRLDQKVPSLNIEFGHFGGVHLTREQTNKTGLFKIKTERCLRRASAVPYLRGSAAAVDLIDAWLDIFSVEFDLEKLQAKNVEVRVSTGIFGIKTGFLKRCSRDEDVNAQFTDNVNAQIEDQKEKLGASTGLSILNTLLSN